MLNLMGVLNATAANVSCTCNCKRFSSLHSMEITQLEFVQILVIVVVMMVMVVVITCLLNHYRLSARSLLSRHGPARRRHLPLANEGGSLWCSEGAAPNAAVTEQVYSPRPPDRGAHSSYLQREAMASQRFQQAYVATAAAARFQPTYPYLPQSLIDLPPTISLSDGEEPPPYQGPCTLQLRDPEQQMELNRESVRAPPNRTVFDSHPLDPSNSYLQPSLQAPPPSLQPGLSMLDAQDAKARHHKPGSHPAPTPPPPAYSEVMGHYYHATSPLTPGHHHHHNQQQQRTVVSSPPSSLLHGLLRPPPPPPRVDHRNARNAKEKSHKPQQV